jgi:hypothetical protein
VAITPPSAITVAINPLPQPPQTSDPANFDVRADAYVLAEQAFSTQVELGRKQINDNAISVAANAAMVQDVAQNVLNAPTTMATSTSSQTISAGSKTFTGLDPSKVLGRGQFVVVSASSSPSNYMLGQVTSPQSGGSVTINVTATGGSGTFSAWDISLQGVQQVVQRYETRRVVKTAGFTASVADHGVVFELSSAATAIIALNPAATLNAGWVCWWINTGSGIWTIDPIGSELIDGVASYTILPGETRLVTCDGTAFKTIIVRPFAYAVTASGTFPVLAPGYSAAAGMLWGGGQGGDRQGYGGYSQKMLAQGGAGSAGVPFTIPASKLTAATSFVVGAGGAGAQIYNVSGGQGGNSTFGTLVTALGAEPNKFSGVRGNYGFGSVPIPGAYDGGWGHSSYANASDPRRGSIFGGGAGESRWCTLAQVDDGSGGYYDSYSYGTEAPVGKSLYGGDGGAQTVGASFGGGGSASSNYYTPGFNGGAGGLKIWGVL